MEIDCSRPRRELTSAEAPLTITHAAHFVETKIPIVVVPTINQGRFRRNSVMDRDRYEPGIHPEVALVSYLCGR